MVGYTEGGRKREERTQGHHDQDKDKAKHLAKLDLLRLFDVLAWKHMNIGESYVLALFWVQQGVTWF